MSILGIYSQEENADKANNLPFTAWLGEGKVTYRFLAPGGWLSVMGGENSRDG
jgi:hypothetical protein